MDSPEIAGAQISLSDLTAEDLAILENQVAKRYQIPLGGKGKRKMDNGNEYILGYSVKYLDSNTHIFIPENTTAYLNIDEPPTRPTKPTTNVKNGQGILWLSKGHGYE
jgi:hypothetical protein